MGISGCGWTLGEIQGDDLPRKNGSYVFVSAGLKADEEGDDFELIQELIDPPKQLGLQVIASHCKSMTSHGSPAVSNWRTGIDVDKFDYFRRDAQHLGIQRQSARVIEEKGVPTISPPEKDRDNIRESLGAQNHTVENLMELRKTLHRAAYQHKTVKKYDTEKVKAVYPQWAFRPVPKEELRFTTAEFNYGMGRSAPQVRS
eukprot:Skav206659  [mRNA]  locus=scaffold1933:595757:599793:+ [translate_table: standard]